MNYPHLVEYFDATSEVAWVRPSPGYTLRTSSAVDAPYVQAFSLREFTGRDGYALGNRLLVPEDDNQTVFVDMDGAMADWRGVIPAGTQLSNNEGSESSLTFCEVSEDFVVTDSSILPGLDTGGNNPISPGPYQPMVTRNWRWAIPRDRVAILVITPMDVKPAPLAVSPAQITWVRFTDIGTSISGGFSTEEGGQTVLTSQRVRTFSVDSLVSASWHEGDYIRSEGQYYVIQSRRVIYDQREIEFDAEANPSFRIVAPPEELV